MNHHTWPIDPFSFFFFNQTCQFFCWVLLKYPYFSPLLLLLLFKLLSFLELIALETCSLFISMLAPSWSILYTHSLCSWVTPYEPEWCQVVCPSFKIQDLQHNLQNMVWPLTASQSSFSSCSPCLSHVDQLQIPAWRLYIYSSFCFECSYQLLTDSYSAARFKSTFLLWKILLWLQKVSLLWYFITLFIILHSLYPSV
jgi:hypothetical protein